MEQEPSTPGQTTSIDLTSWTHDPVIIGGLVCVFAAIILGVVVWLFQRGNRSSGQVSDRARAGMEQLRTTREDSSGKVRRTNKPW